MTTRKQYTNNFHDYDVLGRKPEALQAVSAAYDQEWFSQPTDDRDAFVREKNLETLRELREKLRNEVKLREEQDKAREAKKAEDHARFEAEKKERIMAEIRDGFAGTDADFERLKDQLYDNYLLNAPNEFQQALDRARASGKYSF